MIKTFSHKCLNNFFNNGDTTKIQSDHIKKLRLLLANLNAATKVENMNLPGLGLHKLQGNMKDFWSIKINGNMCTKNMMVSGNDKITGSDNDKLMFSDLKGFGQLEVTIKGGMVTYSIYTD